MKAAYLETTGAPEVLHYGDLPTPQPKSGEVLVRIKAAALNPIDIYILAGTVEPLGKAGTLLGKVIVTP
jgi:NADPH2:quinone reductase